MFFDDLNIFQDFLHLPQVLFLARPGQVNHPGSLRYIFRRKAIDVANCAHCCQMIHLLRLKNVYPRCFPETIQLILITALLYPKGAVTSQGRAHDALELDSFSDEGWPGKASISKNQRKWKSPIKHLWGMTSDFGPIFGLREPMNCTYLLFWIPAPQCSRWSESRR